MTHITRRAPLGALDRRTLIGSGLAAAAGAALPRRARAQEQVLNIYNWDTYIGSETVSQFTEATGIKVRYDLFASNDEMFAKLREGNPGYDIVFATNNWVEKMIVAGMLNDIDHAQLPNFKNLDAKFADPAYDPTCAHSIPYFWGTLGIGYRKGDDDPTTWADLFSEKHLDEKMSVLNDSYTLRCAMKYLGYSVNSKDEKEIDRQRALGRCKRHLAGKRGRT